MYQFNSQASVETLNTKEKPTVFITKEANSIFKHYNDVYTKEWCGIPLLTIDGNLSNLANLKITINGFLLLDLGTEGYTQFKDIPYLEKIDKMFKKGFEGGCEIYNCVSGTLHSH